MNRITQNMSKSMGHVLGVTKVSRNDETVNEHWTLLDDAKSKIQYT